MALHIKDKVNISTVKANGEKDTEAYESLVGKIPYPIKICFRPLLRFFREKAEEAEGAQKIYIENALQALENAKGFKCTFDTKEDLHPYQDLIKLLLAGLFPLANKENPIAMVTQPLSHDPFYVSQGLEKILSGTQGITQINKQVSKDLSMRHIWAGCHILNTHYGQNLQHKPRFFAKIQPQADQTARYYMSALNFDFVDVVLLKEKPELSEKQITELLNNIYDTELWAEYLPYDTFGFHGFTVARLTDITEEEAVSYLKQKLLDKDALTNPEKIKSLEKEMRILLEEKDLRLGIAALDYPDKNILQPYKIRFNFLPERQQLVTYDARGSVYDEACSTGKPVMIGDLKDRKDKTDIERELIESNIRSLIVCPLFKDNGRVIGIMEIASARPGAFNSFTLHKLQKVNTLFDSAMERSREEIDNKIEAVIREEYTTLHDSVEWKFIEHAYDLMNRRENDEADNVQAEPIKFANVYPLYGQADIVGSSLIRNQSIQADLLTNLRAAEEVLEFADKRTEFPLTELHLQETREFITNLSTRIQSSDESEIVDFLHQKIHPYFDFLKGENITLARRIELFYKKLDPNFKIIYDKRKSYEQSVLILNKKVGRYLMKVQREAQKIIPHYYEKYATDGVEFEIYAGNSISHNKEFTDMHLRNLRLWQLETLCEVTRIVHRLQEKLLVPLTTAQMIFVYSLPVSIRFLLDEKHFDVDGAYNVRYKILKKRIDKAVIEGTEERVTVAGKIAVIYTTERDRLEYLEYADFLRNKGLIKDKTEELKLAPLQGVDGLRALRLTVETDENAA